MVDVTVGERFGSRVCLDARSVSRFATAAGDGNPIHHDAAYAARTRFGGLIVSGPQLTALLMGLSATRFSRGQAMLGLDFRFRFVRAARVDEELSLWWEVVAAREKASLGGELVWLAGKAVGPEGDVVKAVGKVLVTDTL